MISDDVQVFRTVHHDNLNVNYLLLDVNSKC